MLDNKNYKLIEIIDKKNEYIINTFKEEIDTNKSNIYSLKDLIKSNKENTDARIEVVEARIDNKISVIDRVLKGDDKQGLVDQVRFLKLGMSIITIVLFLALGGQIYGMNIRDIANAIVGSTSNKHDIEENKHDIEEKPKITESK